MSVQFVVLAGPDKGKVFPLQSGPPLRLGRGRDAALRLTDPQASRTHCEVRFEGDRVVVLDLDSAGGTFVNGARVQQHTLAPGDVLQVGTTRLRLDMPNIVEQSTLSPAAPPKPAPPSSEPLHLLSGKALSHYQVGPVIAPGKTGLVFRARDTRENKDVALKVFFPDFSAEEEEVQRFIRAVKTMLPLHHPHVVTIHGAGKTAGHCWVAMELVEGVSMTQAMLGAAAGSPDWRVAFRVALHVSRALAYLHAQHVLHRNVTPQNVLVRSADATVKLGDLMKAKAQEGKLAKQVTVTGEILGDMRFLSPEQTSGTATVDTRSDLYGLGATTYALLTGRAPLEGKNPIETALLIRQTPPAPPRHLCPAVPPAFEEVVLALLAKKPEERFASAADVLFRLSELASKRPFLDASRREP